MQELFRAEYKKLFGDGTAQMRTPLQAPTTPPYPTTPQQHAMATPHSTATPAALNLNPGAPSPSDDDDNFTPVKRRTSTVNRISDDDKTMIVKKIKKGLYY